MSAGNTVVSSSTTQVASLFAVKFKMGSVSATV
jgi:hypothetical protein